MNRYGVKHLWSHLTPAILAMLLGACNDKATIADKESAIDVMVSTLHRESLNVSTILPGRISPINISEVRPQVSGIIQKRYFPEGSDVKAGQILYKIDPTPHQATLDNSRAALHQAQADASLAALTESRYRKLLGTQYISRQEYDEARARSMQTKAAAEAAQAQVRSAEINLAWTAVTAPVAGRIGRSSVTEGALVENAQSQALATIQQLDEVYVDVTRSGNDVMRLRNDLAEGRLNGVQGKSAVTVIFSDGQEYPEKGRLQFSDVTVDETTGSISMRAIVENKQHILLPGMFVRARIEEGSNPLALLVPQQAVIRTPKGDASVWVVGNDNRATLRSVSAERAVADKWLISSGLQDGERIIVSGLQRVKAGVLIHEITR
ncbi:efflux RND transporter periplasmic adaptor subunit [Klebsiella oxytoca]|uniref:efflux RND transporter periplasmic adaptor subunit n=1 Tax=Klebsiella oxytoca TaxID=571 RepID=UPI00190EE79A|nr:efflux RND transporter periplasmic adaptor subunit [Klebsiella oxytoca]MBK0678712.1 efflux RND transporter periplasmic adaptor subunit [Klebsiella oxytoca]